MRRAEKFHWILVGLVIFLIPLAWEKSVYLIPWLGAWVLLGIFKPTALKE